MERYLDVRVEIAAALATGRPVVALESTVYAHGLPHPRGAEVAAAMDDAIRAEGAVPATIGLLRGRVIFGMTPDEIEILGMGSDIAKVSVRDIAAILATGRAGATTVAATASLASRAGIRVMATGGIGGVHRGGASSFDVSADLVELGRTPVAVICAGAKSVLDLPLTLELLETLGVPVLGFGTSEFPAFYARESGLSLRHRVDRPEQVAAMMDAQSALGLRQALLVVQPPPPPDAIPGEEVEGWVSAALEEAERHDVTGQDVTPFLLNRISASSGGRALAANTALLVSNARLAARIASALSR